MNPETSAGRDLPADLRRRTMHTLAHDLRTPLACVIGALETLQQMQAKLSTEQREALLATALDQAHRLDALFSAADLFDEHSL